MSEKAFDVRAILSRIHQLVSSAWSAVSRNLGITPAVPRGTDCGAAPSELDADAIPIAQRYRGIPPNAKRQRIPMFYASGPQPPLIAARIKDHEEAQRAKRMEGKKSIPAVLRKTDQ